ncbi:beta-1,3-glucan-binding protein [Hyalella azteca]|uniref:Beta-1,3-glucan-binding protein n=1 Tax=Hyalella azteca TaxID=294128 RepID=A0A8B7NLE4_HYAAZ|nr:beta-1,3-glucan-binding protein [Hyalella azteca]XP_018014473.1 beta-1,3-glucan-binding protein [Hyalella azteca]
MKLLLVLAVTLTATQAADIVDPSTCTAFPCQIFNDEFDFFDFSAWEHEMTMGGGGNWEFQAYVNNRSVTYTHDSTLFIKPQLVADWQGEAFLTTGTWDMWGAHGRNEKCTGNAFYGCFRAGANGLLNPVMSGRLRTLPFFGVAFGRVEVRAKLPRGDWLWPAIWMMPRNFEYGLWPASGEIDIVESRGNDNYGNLGNGFGGTTLHWGPAWNYNMYGLTHSEYSPADGSSFADNFHTWRLDWTPDGMTFYLDDAVILTVDPGTNFWDFGGLASSGFENPWRYGSKMSPFDKEFHVILNLAVGGTNGFFPDDVPSSPPKPWSNAEGTAPASFWNARNDWLPTWQNGESTISESAALQVDYVRVWKLS